MRTADGESGITLVEILISILVLGIVLTAFFGVLARNLQSLSDSEARQEASFITAQVLENLRSLPVTAARMASTYDTTSVSCGTPAVTGTVDVFGDGSVCEGLAVDASTAANRIDATTTWADTTNGVTYATYATVVSGSNAVRVTVIADYELSQGPRQIRRSTLISEVNRG